MNTPSSRVMSFVLFAVLASLALLGPASAEDHAGRVGALARAHAHNDYEHDAPLFDALGQGFTSVEADVWLVDGKLLVAHDLEQVKAERTLEALYLEPLRALVQANDGRVHPGFEHSLQLLIDLKSDGAETYRALHDVLAQYSDILSVFSYRHVQENAVTAVISGNRPLELIARQRVRYAAYDGRWSDAGTDADAAFIPLVSDNWTKQFKWDGVGAIPEDEAQKLHDFVAAVHEQGRRVRFWATPDDPERRQAVWSELVEAGVDYINTDDLAGLSAFLQEQDAHASEPTVDWFGGLGELVQRSRD
jgi:hypothetical protein